MKELVLGLLDIMTIVTTLALCKASGKAERIQESLNKLNINTK
ncbi:hypothetical protein P8V03_07230 [Clostridium sp. A1-XYC3]|uniref:Uncharacterized protein n=1 Tax=Clostridium tanneri TaxID=3037988 RepID=A0ABU4JS21_9CLOT|nr:hypothetical protein [Clostridium sp. A1-XYC3]MDW8800944.1 hypothetical protein [Clostridium sp. A1-XYC3]